MELERLAFCLRKRVEHEAGIYFASCRGRTIVYKGMLTHRPAAAVLPRPVRRALRLRDRAGALAVLDQHLPVLAAGPPVPLHRAQRRDQHRPGQPQLDAGPRGACWPASLIPGDLDRLFPICTPGGSDSASFDEVLELLHLGGRSLPHAVLMMIPEAWENNAEMDPARRAFYEFHACADGALGRPGLRRLHRRHGDRRGARPQRAAARRATGSPTTAWSCWPARSACSTSTRPRVVRKGRLQPGRMFLVDTAAGPDRRRRRDQGRAGRRAPVRRLAARRPDRTCDDAARPRARRATRTSRWSAGSRPSATPRRSCGCCSRRWPGTGAEPIGSMGTDTPIAVLSERPRLLFDYFTQLFAQVTNPPLDAIREELVTSLATAIGPERNLLDPTPASCRQIVLPFPVHRQRRAGQDHPHQRRRRPARLRRLTWSTACTGSPAAATALRGALERIAAEVDARRSPTAPRHRSCSSDRDSRRRATRRSRRCC